MDRLQRILNFEFTTDVQPFFAFNKCRRPTGGDGPGDLAFDATVVFQFVDHLDLLAHATLDAAALESGLRTSAAQFANANSLLAAAIDEASVDDGKTHHTSPLVAFPALHSATRAAS